MEELICPRCNKRVYRLLFAKSEIGCRDCIALPPKNTAKLHTKVGNSEVPWLTVAGNDVITHRTFAEDNHSVIDSRTGRESPQLS